MQFELISRLTQNRSTSNINDILTRNKFQHSAFFHDLLAYSMKQLGHRWTLLAKPNIQRSKLFQPQIGDAVLRYHISHTIDIILEINRIRPRGKMNQVLVLVAELTFKEGNFAKEFFRFCAQIVTIGNHFLRRNQDYHLDKMVFSMGDVYDTFLKQRFMSLGGWHVFKNYAIRYRIYGE